MAIKLIALDLDGTLLGADYVTIPAGNITALRAARAKGVLVTLASGRTWSLLTGAVEQLGGLDYAIMANGAAVRQAGTGETVYRQLMPNAQAAEIVGLLHREGIPFEVYCDGQNYVRAADRELVWEHNIEGYKEFFDGQTRYVPDLVGALAGRDVEKFNLFWVPPEKRQAIETAVRATGPVALANAFGENMEFTAGGVNKGRALQGLAAHLGLGPEEVMAFGDAGNDLEMLTWAWWSFAMENGTAQAKAAARFRAPANIEAGVGQMVSRCVLEKDI